MMSEFFGDVLKPFPLQRFECDLQHAVRVVRWHARSSAFVHDTMVWAQWPQLCYEIGPAVVDLNGPEDLQLLAIVELVKRRQAGRIDAGEFHAAACPEGQFSVMTPEDIGAKYGGVLERMVELLGSTPKGLSFGAALAKACAELGHNVAELPPEAEEALLTASFKIIGGGRLPGAPDA